MVITVLFSCPTGNTLGKCYQAKVLPFTPVKVLPFDFMKTRKNRCNALIINAQSPQFNGQNGGFLNHARDQYLHPLRLETQGIASIAEQLYLKITPFQSVTQQGKEIYPNLFQIARIRPLSPISAVSTLPRRIPPQNGAFQAKERGSPNMPRIPEFGQARLPD